MKFLASREWMRQKAMEELDCCVEIGPQDPDVIHEMLKTIVAQNKAKAERRLKTAADVLPNPKGE